jgi:membrane protein DedA with SNARE-associated domain
VVSIPAGFRRMRLVPFIVYTAMGSAVWNTALVGAGAVLGNQWDKVEPYVAVLQYVVIAVIVLFVVRFALKKLRNRT